VTPTEAYLAGLLTLPAVMILIALARPTRTAGYQPVSGAVSTSPPQGGSGALQPKDITTIAVELEGIDKIEASLARITKAASEAGDRLREVADLGARIDH
jgi:hypothetical protein